MYNRILTDYSSKEYEVEYLFNINIDYIKRILLHMTDEWATKAKLEQSINFIYNRSKDVSAITRYTFLDVINKKQDSYDKTRIISEIDPNYSSVKLKVSKEEESAPVKSNLKLIRIKNRLSIKQGVYRFDITQISEIPAVQFELDKMMVKNNRELLFGNLIKLKGKELYSGFIANLSNKYKTEFEVEIIGFKTEGELKLDNLFKYVEPLYVCLESANIINKVGTLFGATGKMSLKSVLSKAVTLSKSSYNESIYPPVGHLITVKADGERCLLYIKKSLCILITTNVVYDFYIKESYDETILDAELIGNDIIIFDGIMVNGRDINKSGLLARITEIKKLKLTAEKYKIVFKDYFIIDEKLEESFRAVIDYKFNYPDDGYIMSSANDSYSYTKHYKIKEHNTIDFLAIKAPDNAGFIKKPGYELYVLFSGISKLALENLMLSKIDSYDKFFPTKSIVPSHMRAVNDYLPIQFSPSDSPKAYLWYVDKELNKKLTSELGKSILPGRANWIIVELEAIFNKEGYSWKFHRVREDRINEPRYFGNDFIKVAQHNWLISQDPIKIKEMHVPVDSYFGQGKDSIYRGQTSMISAAKSAIINEIRLKTNNNFIIDLASGKGQDLFRYINAGFNKGLFLEYDRVALATLMHRRYEMLKSTTDTPFETYVGVRDLTEPAEEILKSIEVFLEKGRPGFVNCNLAMHYLIYDMAHLNNFGKLVSSLLNSGGYFAYTSFDGRKITDLLKGKEEWISREGEVLKYHIKKKYKTDELTGFGQTIEVKLPFGKYYEESLINHDAVKTVFKKYGLSSIEQGSMLDFYSSKIRINLTDEDKKYVDLYQYEIFIKS